MSESYEIYKEAVEGKTWNGEDMKNFDEIPDKIKRAWVMIDYTKTLDACNSCNKRLAVMYKLDKTLICVCEKCRNSNKVLKELFRVKCETLSFENFIILNKINLENDKNAL